MPVSSSSLDDVTVLGKVEEIGAVDNYESNDNRIFQTFSIRDPSRATTFDIHALIDSGSTHEVLSEKFLVNRTDLPTELLPKDLLLGALFFIAWLRLR